MGYKARIISRTEIYHVMIRGINHEKIFEKIFYKHVIKGIMRKKMENKNVKILAYCIMDTHLHLLIKAPIDELSLFMSRVENAYARFYNKSLSRNGHVFQNRFKSECVETEDYFYCCLRYIYKNPVKAGMCQRPEDYEFSSLYEISHNKLFIINEEDLQKIEIKEFSAYDDAAYLFKDTPDDTFVQKINILKKLIYYYMEIYDLHTIYQIFEREEIRESLVNEYKRITKSGFKCANHFIFQYILNNECA